MNWDGKNVSGIINPGPDVILMKVVTLFTSWSMANWTTSFPITERFPGPGITAT
jgi:hypothetical protein